MTCLAVNSDKIMFKGREYDLLNFEVDAFYDFDGDMTQEEIDLYEDICSQIDVTCVEDGITWNGDDVYVTSYKVTLRK